MRCQGVLQTLLKRYQCVQKEGLARLASRAALLPWPGFSDHYPYGYVEALREDLDLHQS